jgi:hypothetical protein
MGESLWGTLKKLAKKIFSGAKKADLPPVKPPPKKPPIIVHEGELPRKPGGRPKPDTMEPHTQIGTHKSKDTGEVYAQQRDFGPGGEESRRLDYSTHPGRPDPKKAHTNPHQHTIDNTDPRNPKMGDAEPVNPPPEVHPSELQPPSPSVGETIVGGAAAILAPYAIDRSKDPNASVADVISAGGWDVAKAIDPFFVTDALEWVFGLEEPK